MLRCTTRLSCKSLRLKPAGLSFYTRKSLRFDTRRASFYTRKFLSIIQMLRRTARLPV